MGEEFLSLPKGYLGYRCNSLHLCNWMQKILIYFILVSLQITSGIVNLAPGVSRASAIKNAAELGSDPTV